MTKCLFVLILCSNVSFAAIHSIKSGKWGDPTTWSSNTVPLGTDTVAVSTGHNISLSMDKNECVSLTIGGSLYFSSPNKLLHSNVIILTDEGNFSSQILGSVFSNRVEIKGINVIEGCNFEIRDSLSISGSLNFLRRSGYVKINNLMIHSTGKWQVPDNRSFIFSGNIRSFGEFSSGAGTYEFAGEDTIKGKLIAFEKIKIEKQLIVQDSIKISEEANASNLGFLKCLNDAYLEIGTTRGNFNVKNLDLTTNKNTICFSRANDQSLPETINNQYSTILVKTKGKLRIETAFNFCGDIIIDSLAELELSEKEILLNGNGQNLIVKNSAKLRFQNYVGSNQVFLNNFQNKLWEDGSTLIIVDKGDVVLNEKLLGNLEIDLTNDTAKIEIVCNCKSRPDKQLSPRQRDRRRLCDRQAKPAP